MNELLNLTPRGLVVARNAVSVQPNITQERPKMEPESPVGRSAVTGSPRIGRRQRTQPDRSVKRAEPRWK
jgi:hypothetical protein